MLTFEQIKELIELVAERKLDGLRIERSGFSLKIQGQQSRAVLPPVPTTVTMESPATVAAAPSVSVPVPMDESASEGETQIPDGTHILSSPIVGTFYRAPSPESETYVEIGSRVKVGQNLCIVEAMKVMNEIESDVDGVIVEIFPKNSQPVEYGERLFAIRTS